MLFRKMHGLGNDFVMVNGDTQKLAVEIEALAEAVCDRHLGVGADGLIIIDKKAAAGCDLRFRIYNSDGTEAEMCGNGIRCAAVFANEQSLTDKTKIVFDTKAGKVITEITGEAVRVNMGQPRLAPDQIPALFDGDQVVSRPLIVGGMHFDCTLVSMGNPHCVIFVDDVDNFPVTDIGPRVEKHEVFPAKINAHFVQKVGENRLRLRVWERGCGVTLACGTGACATAVAAVLNGLTGRKVEIELVCGSLFIEWNAEDNCVYMTGPATCVFDGKLSL